jgi:hypothetical protein
MNGGRFSWLAGAATTSFPIPSGTPMAGYMARIGPSTGTLDDLAVSALVLIRESTKLVILAVDLVGVDEALVTEIAAASSLERSELVVCASHTHSGPAGVIPRLHPADDDRSSPELRQRFVSICAGAIASATDTIESVDLLFGRRETSGLATNRNDPNGPFDPYLSVLATRRPDGDVASVLVHFACHPTILSAGNRLISADFPGALRRTLRTTLNQNGKPPVVLYVNGAAGDVGTRFTRSSQDVTEVERIGAGLAGAAASALAAAKPVEGPIRYDRQTVMLPPRSLAEIPNIEHDQLRGDSNAADARKQVTRRQGAEMLRKLIEAGPDVIRSSLELEAWGLGNLVLIAVPGELFASLGARIASASTTLVLGYANEYVGYLVDESAFASSTYEALAGPYAPGTGERVAEIGHDLVSRVRTGNER